MHLKYRRKQPERLRFPPHLKFTSVSNRLFECNGKLVQIIPSLHISKQDNPPTDINFYGIGKYKFNLTEAEILIFSFYNDNTKQTECAILPKDEFLPRLKSYHFEGEKVNINLFLTFKGQLMEGYDAGAEGWFMGIWLDEQRDFTRYYNNWSVFLP